MTDELTDKAMAEMEKVFERDASQLPRETRFKEDLVASSMDKFTLVAVVEDLTGQSVTYGQMNKRKTVGEYLDWLHELTAE